MSETNPPESASALPEIKVGPIKDIAYVQMEVECEDATYDKLVAYGKEDATDADYFKIAFNKALQSYYEDFIESGDLKKVMNEERKEGDKET
jgi:hypothetical protein